MCKYFQMGFCEGQVFLFTNGVTTPLPSVRIIINGRECLILKFLNNPAPTGVLKSFVF
jgi:hypothetical protein